MEAHPGLIQSSIFLVIEDDEQYSVASIATLRCSKTPVAEGDEHPSGNVRPMCDTFSVEAVGYQFRRVSLTLFASPYAILFVAFGDFE